MLRSFRVANHRSIRDEQELLLMPAYDKQRPVVPVAAVFGANASGKTNLLNALLFMQQAVLASHWRWQPGQGVPREPFRLASAAPAEPSHFTVEIVVTGVRYVYGFAVDDRTVREEWLYTYPRNRKRIIFEREMDGRWAFGTTVPRGEAEVLRKLTRDNELFLGVAAHSELAVVMPVFDWFQRALTIRTPATARHLPEVVEWLEQSDEHGRSLVELVRAADLGIEDLRVEPVFAGAQSHPVVAEMLPVELTFVHGPERVPMRTEDQSAGTLAWLHLLVPALDALERGAVMCVDEIDSSLHPRLTARLIELFRDERTNEHGAQLVFATHDATLLGTSFGADILARDGVWFVDKNDRGETKLYPLTDFYPRKEENRERRYLGGSYDAVPAVYSGTLVERLLRIRQESAGVA